MKLSRVNGQKSSKTSLFDINCLYFLGGFLCKNPASLFFYTWNRLICCKNQKKLMTGSMRTLFKDRRTDRILTNGSEYIEPVSESKKNKWHQESPLCPFEREKPTLRLEHPVLFNLEKHGWGSLKILILSEIFYYVWPLKCIVVIRFFLEQAYFLLVWNCQRKLRQMRSKDAECF